MAETPDTFCDLPCRDAREYFAKITRDTYPHIWLVDEKWLLGVSVPLLINEEQVLQVFVHRRNGEITAEWAGVPDTFLQYKGKVPDMLGAYVWLKQALEKLVYIEREGL